MLTREQLIRYTESWKGERFADGRAESPLESVSRVACHELGLPAPEAQVEVWLGDELIARVDFLWRGQLTVGEADGKAKYLRVEDLWAEKRREDRLRRVGLSVARWEWQEAWRPCGVLDVRLRESFAGASDRRLDPRVRFVSTQPRTVRRAACSRSIIRRRGFACPEGPCPFGRSRVCSSAAVSAPPPCLLVCGRVFRSDLWPVLVERDRLVVGSDTGGVDQTPAGWIRHRSALQPGPAEAS